jgi:hypothetical protein
MTTEDALNHHFVAVGIDAEGCTCGVARPVAFAEKRVSA